MLSFADRCYEILKTIPAGKVTTYKLLGNALGTKAYRAVGTAMAKNPNVPQVPCHRVVHSNGRIGQYVAGTPKKIQLLTQEGITIKNGQIMNFEEVLFIPRYSSL